MRNAVLGRDFTVDLWADLVTIVHAATRARAAAQPLSVDRGIEVGHVFQLGTKYSEALDAHYTDEHGEQHPMVMGCYGIGVSRVVAAVVEEHHDEHGIAWPAALAPYDVHLVALPGKGDRRPTCSRTADRLYDELRRRGRRRALRRPRREPGREVRRRRPARHAGAARRRREGPGARASSSARTAPTGTRDDLPVAEVVSRLIGRRHRGLTVAAARIAIDRSLSRGRASPRVRPRRAAIRPSPVAQVRVRRRVGRLAHEEARRRRS